MRKLVALQHKELPLARRVREGLFIVCLSVSLFLLLALVSYHRSDTAWSHIGFTNHVANVGGRAGAWFADVFLYAFGFSAYFFPLLFIYGSWLTLNDLGEWKLRRTLVFLRILGFILILASACGLASLKYSGNSAYLPFSAGGILGNIVGFGAAQAFGTFGTSLLLLAGFLSGVTLFTGLSWLQLMDLAGRYTLKLTQQSKSLVGRLLKSIAASLAKKSPEQTTEKIAPIVASQPPIPKEPTPEKPAKIRIEPKVEAIKPSKRVQKESQLTLFTDPSETPLPPLSLLDLPKQTVTQSYSHAQLEQLSRDVEQRLLDFGVEVQVVAVHPGPVVTRFEMQLAAGVKVSKITSLAKDLARSLSVVSVRVVEVIPGKPVVGLELPNKEREVVYLREILSSQAYEQSKSVLTLGLGKDIAGHPMIVDLAKMPHCLVAGTTGSGKSVGVNAMLLSLLYKATPSEVRLIMIDPKMLELSVYQGIPHLLAPVVTDMREAANALRWCVAEMERRYRLMAALGVRNLAGYNKKIEDAIAAGTPIIDPLWPADQFELAPPLETLPAIVVVIDEFADMMMVVGKKVEQLIARIAQKARAAGIHMILATQRPSVDVITGLIKSNIPTRIAFQVSSKIDSRTILDQGGADQLLGHGDMLYLAPGTGTPIRIHGAFVGDHEVHQVAEEWRRRGAPAYIKDITDHAGENSGGGTGFIPGIDEDEESDPIYDEAVFFVTQTRKASISSVQRRFKIGYNRAARLIEQMEASGVVSSMETNGSREVLAPSAQEAE